MRTFVFLYLTFALSSSEDATAIYNGECNNYEQKLYFGQPLYYNLQVYRLYRFNEIDIKLNAYTCYVKPQNTYATTVAHGNLRGLK